ncbi:MAG: hypothetical protein CVU51_16825 [Deltaproteobacteria bacterium HGW-Deltaproteobacteria-1]|nr:MAG: hypothetical protein CVU51_16825 [Deltaproteobacteria bacterium HGW-Deltaproteobacteria-1]
MNRSKHKINHDISAVPHDINVIVFYALCSPYLACYKQSGQSFKTTSGSFLRSAVFSQYF